MARIREKNASRESTVSSESPSVELLYVVDQSEDDGVVKALIQATIPAFYGDLVFQQYSYRHLGNGVWDVTVTYGKRTPKTAGDQTFTFDTTGGTTKLTQGLEDPVAYTFQSAGPVDPGLPPPDYIPFFGAIGVTISSDNVRTVDGVDVVIPQFSFTIQRVIAHPLDGNYVQSLYDLTGAVNDALLSINVSGVELSFAEGELKFDGATGSQRGADDWEITLRFAASKNASIADATDLVIGTIDEIEKEGHQYLWVHYEDSNQNNHFVPKPRQVMIETVHPKKDLSVLFA